MERQSNHPESPQGRRCLHWKNGNCTAYIRGGHPCSPAVAAAYEQCPDYRFSNSIVYIFAFLCIAPIASMWYGIQNQAIGFLLFGTALFIFLAPFVISDLAMRVYKPLEDWGFGRRLLLGVLISIGLMSPLVKGYIDIWDQSPMTKAAQEYRQQIAGVCSRQGIDGAPAYGKIAGTHKAIPVDYFDDWPSEWYPDSMASTELVFCKSGEQVEIQKCSSAPVTRYQYNLSVSLIEARTGNEVAENTFKGPLPEACPNQAGADQAYYGEEFVFGKDIVDWARPYIEIK